MHSSVLGIVDKTQGLPSPSQLNSLREIEDSVEITREVCRLSSGEVETWLSSSLSCCQMTLAFQWLSQREMLFPLESWGHYDSGVLKTSPSFCS